MSEVRRDEGRKEKYVKPDGTRQVFANEPAKPGDPSISAPLPPSIERPTQTVMESYDGKGKKPGA